MKMKDAVRLLKLMPTTLQTALTVAEISEKWYGYEASKEEKRNIQRYVNDLSDPHDGDALVNVIDGPPRRFYLRLSQVANWFMSEELALTILLNQNVMRQALESFVGTGKMTTRSKAEAVASASVVGQRIREKVRVVPDGIGRLAANIEPDVLKAVMDSISTSRQVSFDYRSSSGAESTALVSVHGLIAKDGTFYLIGAQGVSDHFRYYGLQRMRNVEVSHKAHQHREGFDLDDFIAGSNLSSRMREEPENIDLELIVRKDAIYHFRERPLANNQVIGEPDSDGRYSVAANIPWTVALLPFLLGLGAGVEVITSARLRLQVQTALEESAALYRGVG